VGAVDGTLRGLTQEYGSSVDFLAVYITEAHARDEWFAGSKLSNCSQPTTRKERLTLANELMESKKVSIPMLVDDIDNRFESTFACWPVRFYIFQNGRIALKAQPRVDINTYDFNEIRGFLEQSSGTDGTKIAHMHASVGKA
jgi:hypothetical protein